MATGSGVALAYGEQQMATLEGRSLEAVVLLKAARRLQEVLEKWESIQSTRDLEALADALKYNQRLWSVFQVDVASPSNPLPLEVRRNILTLSRFVDRCTFQLLAAPEQNRVETLIDINRSLAEGLDAARDTTRERALAVPPEGSSEPDAVFDLCY